MIVDRVSATGSQDIATELYRWATDLFPICRSITGRGLRETLGRLAELLPLTIHEVPTGTRVLDWTIPLEWNIREAWVENSRGDRVIDFRRSNLHVVSYSRPVRARLGLAELKPHLLTLPEHPDWIPYRTTYYSEGWGFCLSHRQFLSLAEDEYEVCIDTSLEPGHLSYAESVLPGETDEEVLISCHVCHPSLGNDNLSGVVVAAFLGRHLVTRARRYTYRLLFVPGTIGAITWLALNESRARRITHGLVLTSLGDPGHPTYKRSRRGNATIDRVVSHVLAARGGEHEILDFSPSGYDERQYCSPGFDLPVGRLSRALPGGYPEYHTSADNLDFIRPAALADSFALCAAVLDVLDANRTYVSRNPKGEPQLGRRGLYHAVGGGPQEADESAMLWVLNLADGRHTLLDIAERARLPFTAIQRAAERLMVHDLLEEPAGQAAPGDAAVP